MVKFNLQEYLAGLTVWSAHLSFEAALNPFVKACLQDKFPDQAYDDLKKKWQEEDHKYQEQGEALRLKIAKTAGDAKLKLETNNNEVERSKLGLEGYMHELKEGYTQKGKKSSVEVVDLLSASSAEVDNFCKENKIDPKQVCMCLCVVCFVLLLLLLLLFFWICSQVLKLNPPCLFSTCKRSLLYTSSFGKKQLSKRSYTE